MTLADKVIRELQLPAMLITHNMSYAVNFGSRLLMMNQGNIIGDYADGMKKNLKVTDLYDWFDHPVKQD